jgi:hypothetical protein
LIKRYFKNISIENVPHTFETINSSKTKPLILQPPCNSSPQTTENPFYKQVVSAGVKSPPIAARIP